ncbi:MAG TPA: DUF881 domain-containing protein [Actinotalea sp.]|jgi:uncharacterized protein YlxW (UPF0749 family)
MTERHRATRRRGVRGALGVGLVLVLAGGLFSANARLAGGFNARQPQDLPHLVQAEVARADTLATRVQSLRGEVDRLTDAENSGMPAAEAAELQHVSAQAGRTAVTGPGVTIALDDASPSAPHPDYAVPDDLVVHQQDLQGVINALWAGGAEAMTLQGERVVSTSAFRCGGNILVLHGRVYSPPYVIKAIGDPSALRKAVLDAEPVDRYLQWVKAVGLGWSLSTDDSLKLPAYQDNLELRYASLPKGADALSLLAGS